ncbi:MAG: ferric aerobactin receptor [Bacteroidetes bacterium]|nr:ferric aerobactin receptor [Bacteroidota bacterium]
MRLKYILLLVFLTAFNFVFSQNGVIKGRVYNQLNNEAIAFANIVLDSTNTGTTTNIDGTYRIENLQPGVYNLICSFVGFRRFIAYEIYVSPSKPTILDIPLEYISTQLDEIQIKAPPFNKTPESPVSLRSIGSTEIYRSPGGNRDISKVIQVLPGVSSTVSFRNDIIVRGGAPNENRFYLDGIEVPNINHFATQGSSGGPVGMINVDFIREVDFYAGAFPANRGNALSSVMDFKQIKGNDEKLYKAITLGSSDLGLTLNGPSGENSSYILSLRRSYLQVLFKALKLPFLPTYNDIQYKHSFKIDDKNQLTIIGLGAIDDFKLNKDVNDGVTDPDILERNTYILGNIPVNSQWNYTIGAVWKHFRKNSYQTFVISRNHLHNEAIKYKDNTDLPQDLILDYVSEEAETKFRFESTGRSNGWKTNFGFGLEHARYTNSTFNLSELNGMVRTIDFQSSLNFGKMSAFAQIGKSFKDDKLILSLGIRTDLNTYSTEMANPIDQLSPRFSIAYALSSKWFLNFNMGRYYQLPPYTVMGFRDNNNILVNKDNKITYIKSDQIVAGIEFNPNPYAKITIESFFKTYSNYPFLVDDQISLANLGGDFGVIGNEEVTSTSDGRAYGIEVFMQQKLSDKFYGILSYTWVRSEFKDLKNEYVASSWDNKHILNITAGKKLNRNWEVGFKFRLLGGAPFTPYDRSTSALKAVWDVTNEGIFDWSRLNQERYPVSHALDIRVDKKWFFKRWTLELFMDIQNIYNKEIQGPAYLDVARDQNGMKITDPNDPLKYQLKEIENTNGNLLPSIGIMIEF